MELVCDRHRHLVCVPFSVKNLHLMARMLGIGRHWFHGGRLPHYDIPVRRVAEVTARCRVVTSREVLRIIKEGLAGPDRGDDIPSPGQESDE